MKVSRQHKVVGLAIAERSLLAAEVVGGESPQVNRLAEFAYPAGISLDQPAELGSALGRFLNEKGFTARAAVIGLPARWLLVKSKEVPPADSATLADLLRLQAEGEFSSELKDLVYDYTGGSGEAAGQVLLIATQRKYVDGLEAMCEAAKLAPAVVTSSAMALGAATRRKLSSASLVLAVSGAGTELTAQSAAATSALRHLRSASIDRPLIGELRRAVSTTPANGLPHELVMWDDSGLDPESISRELGFAVRSGELAALGVSANQAAANGEGRRYAAAVALALVVADGVSPGVNFLHSRLAPVKKQRVPRWVFAAVAGGVLLIGGIIAGYQYVQNQQADLTVTQGQLTKLKDQITTANAFVSKVSFAQRWHGGNPRYLACLRDLTNAIPEDDQTYATGLVIRESAKQTTANSPSGSTGTTKPAEAPTLSGVLAGKTTDQQRVWALIDRMKHVPAFTDVKSGGADAGHAREVNFSISFTYVPAPAAVPVASTK